MFQSDGDDILHDTEDDWFPLDDDDILHDTDDESFQSHRDGVLYDGDNLSQSNEDNIPHDKMMIYIN